MKSDQSLNVMLYVISFFPTVGGREVVVHYLAKWLKRLGHNPRVVGPSGWIRNRKYKFEYPVHRYPTLRGIFPEQVHELNLYIDSKCWKTDIIHAHSTFPNAYFVSQLSSLDNCPLAVTPHGEDIHVIPEINFGFRMDPVKNKKILKSLDRADCCTAISSDVTNSLLDAGTDQEKIIEIPNGIDLERYDAKYKVDIRNKYGLPADSKIILSVASYHVKRGFEYLVDAFSDIEKEEKNCYLMIAGRGTEVLLDQIRALGIEDKIKLLGQIPPPFMEKGEDLLAAVYTQSDIYVSASMASGAEGLSLALLDAMGARLPIVATDISGNNDVVEEGVNGYLVTPGTKEGITEKVLCLLKDKSMMVQYGHASRTIAADYSWENITKKYISVYRQIIEKKNKL